MHKSSGFTLVELVIVVVIVSIVSTVVIPSFRAIIQDNRLAVNTNLIVEGLNLTLSEATRCSCQVTMCKSTNGSTCVNDGTGDDWQTGWIVFADNGDLGEFDATDGDTLVRSFELTSDELTLTAGNVIKDYVSFNARAQPRSGNGGLMAVADTFGLCDTRGASEARKIELSNIGHIKLETGVASCP
ncbi:MAG: GspH/FimT family protein [Candidatus Competibacterales bacterium]